MTYGQNNRLKHRLNRHINYSQHTCAVHRSWKYAHLSTNSSLYVEYINNTACYAEL